jgi:hypothetical protein
MVMGSQKEALIWLIERTLKTRRTMDVEKAEEGRAPLSASRPPPWRPTGQPTLASCRCLHLSVG